MNNDQLWTAGLTAILSGSFASAVIWAAIRTKFSDLLIANQNYKDFKKNTKQEMEDLRKEVKEIRGAWMEMATKGVSEISGRINDMESKLQKEMHANALNYSKDFGDVKAQLSSIMGRLGIDLK